MNGGGVYFFVAANLSTRNNKSIRIYYQMQRHEGENSQSTEQ